MKKYLTILILFFSFTASAQIIYTPMSAGGYQMKYLKTDSGFALPFRDTTIGRGVNRPGLLVVNTQDSILYIFNGKKWTPAYVDSTGVIGLIKNKVDSVTLSGNNLFYWSNGTGYGSQLNKLDSIYMSNDSVYTCIAGNCTFRYINSGLDSLSFHSASLNSDSTQLSLTRANGTKDTIPLPFVKKTDTTVIKVHYPVWAFSSDSLGLRTDSMPKLEYASAIRDTSTWDNQTLIDKQFLQDRISTITSTGITRAELQDTAAAIRGSIPASTDTTSLSNRINQKLNISDTASMLSLYAKTADVPDQFNPIAGTGMTLSGTYPNITFNSSGSGGSSSGVDSTNTATSAGQTVFTFPYTLTSYTVSSQVTRNGVLINPADYTVNTGDITFTGFTCDSGDKIRFIGIK